MERRKKNIGQVRIKKKERKQTGRKCKVRIKETDVCRNAWLSCREGGVMYDEGMKKCRDGAEGDTWVWSGRSTLVFLLNLALWLLSLGDSLTF